MRILIAPNAFKGSLSASAVCRHLSEGIRAANSQEVIETVPLADGGDGTLEVMVELWGGHLREFPVRNPLGHVIQGPVGFDSTERRAVIEMARASGLALLEESERNPLKTSSFGTGELIRAAIESGATDIYLGIGGSSTNEGGAGMGAALGFEHLDAEGKALIPCGANLDQIVRIRAPKGHAIPEDLKVTVLCDVTNPLCGENGASSVYGPQKGASKSEVQILDSNLKHLAEVWKRDLGKEVASMPGAGAAGGMGAGAAVYLGAELVSGTEVLLEMTHLEDRIRSANLILTGEGALDRTSLEGKIPGRVAQLAKRHGKPCYGICGIYQEKDADLFLRSGFSEVMEIAPTSVPIEERIEHAARWVFQTGERIGRRFL